VAGASQHARTQCFGRAFHDRRYPDVHPAASRGPADPVTLSQLQLTAADTAEDHAVSSQRLCGHASNDVISNILRNITKIKRSEPALQAASDMLWHLICHIDTGNIILK